MNDNDVPEDVMDEVLSKMGPRPRVEVVKVREYRGQVVAVIGDVR